LVGNQLEDLFGDVYTVLEEQFKSMAIESHLNELKENNLKEEITVEAHFTRKALAFTTLGEQFYSACVVETGHV
jgi:hypothetical protein